MNKNSSYLETTEPLSPFWFLTFKPIDGRCGHTYTAPFLMTVVMLLRNLFRLPENRAAWRRKKGSEYQSARIMVVAPSKAYGIEDAPRLPWWVLSIEYQIRRMSWRIKAWNKKRKHNKTKPMYGEF